MEGKKVNLEREEQELDYTELVQSPTFQRLMREKRRFILPFSLFFLAFYFTLPVLTAYFTFLNETAFWSLTWAWVFAFAQFVMTWALCMIYTKRAQKFDVLVEDLKKEAGR
ncbi:DUF485 domain-containing protein [Priestia filamentosa]|uniref:DUF485 domain-containing protein n=1 Tax=Priestia filamentosa TaxID=1402861 RepID=UPI001FB45D65|nr:DUF485 domain-containing protein [Priestia filamentosa]UOE60919.1 DUF485 domain-containing protein [Priestia filamentosa]